MALGGKGALSASIIRQHLKKNPQWLTRKIHHPIKLLSVFKKKSCFHNMVRIEVFDIESEHNLSVVMIFSVQKLSLCVFHNCEYIIILQGTYLYGYPFANSCVI